MQGIAGFSRTRFDGLKYCQQQSTGMHNQGFDLHKKLNKGKGGGGGGGCFE